MIREILDRIRFWRAADRIGPDMPLTHWMLHFPSFMQSLCQKKFRRFDVTSCVRPGVYAVACSNIEIGKNVVLRPGTMLFSDPDENGSTIRIRDEVLIGSGVHIYVGNHRFDNPELPISQQGHSASSSVLICEGAWLGANVTVLPGVTVGRNCVIGAGSVVTTSIPDFSLAVGSPARVIKQLN
ncbi:MAG: acyltransferase [Halioglobus sp.]